MKITLIAAMDDHQLIGKDNKLPWHLPADLKFFKQQTSGKTVLMGRKTCESLPFPLPNRHNLVISKNPAFSKPGFEVIHNINKTFEVDDLMVIGGAKIYELMLPYATHLIITKIHAAFDGDTYFPAINWQQWRMTRLTNNPISASNPNHEFDFIFYEKSI